MVNGFLENAVKLELVDNEKEKTNNSSPNIDIGKELTKKYDIQEDYFCERCLKKISYEDYELYDCMCEDCFEDISYKDDDCF